MINVIKKMVICLLIFFSIGSGVAHIPEEQSVSQDLLQLIKVNPEIKPMLIESIKKSQDIVPNKKYNPVQSFDEFLDYVDRYAHTLPGTLPPGNVYDKPGTITRESVHQNIMYLYFLINQPLPELANKGYFKNTLQYYPPFTQWLIELSAAKGKFLSSSASWSDKTYEEYRAAPAFNLSTGCYGNKNLWKTYNDFFARNVIPGSRPIASPNDQRIVVAPADSIPQGVWKIDDDNNIQISNGLKVKYKTYYNVNQLLKSSPYKNTFKNGYLSHTYLNVNDYHHYIFPVAGTIIDKRFETENMSLDVYWDASKMKYALEARTGWQFSETRGYVLVKTPNHGIVAIIPIGMEQVSSVNFDENVRVGGSFKKGDALGYFLFGASDIIMLFEEKTQFTMDVLKNENGQYIHLLAGEKYGRINAFR